MTDTCIIWLRFPGLRKVIAEALPFAELLAGFAIAAQVSFVTFDRGFSRYGQLSLTLLSGSVA